MRRDGRRRDPEAAVVTSGSEQEESRPFEVPVGLPTFPPLAASSPRHARTVTESLQQVPVQSAAREIHFPAVAKECFVMLCFRFLPLQRTIVLTCLSNTLERYTCMSSIAAS